LPGDLAVAIRSTGYREGEAPAEPWLLLARFEVLTRDSGAEE